MFGFQCYISVYEILISDSDGPFAVLKCYLPNLVVMENMLL